MPLQSTEALQAAALQNFTKCIETTLEGVFAKPPSYRERIKFTSLLITGTTILGIIGFYSAFSFWYSSAALAVVINYELDIQSRLFEKIFGTLLAISGVGSNGLQATDILLEQLLDLRKKLGDPAHYLLNQKTWPQFFKKNYFGVIAAILSGFAVIPIGFMAYEDDGLVNAILIALLNWIISYRGVTNLWHLLPTSPFRTSEQKKYDRLQSLLAEKIEQSADALIQLSYHEINETLQILRLKKDDAQDKLNLPFFLDASHFTKRHQATYFVGPKHSPVRRITIGLSMLLIVIFQFGYPLEALIAGERISAGMGILSFSIAALVYAGLTLDAAKELGTEVFNGKKTISAILAPRVYKYLRILFLILASLSGATLGLLNSMLTSGISPTSPIYNETDHSHLHLPKGVSIASGIMGFFSDAFSNMFYIFVLVHTLIGLYMRHCINTNSKNSDQNCLEKRQVARLHNGMLDISNLIQHMDTQRFTELLAALTQQSSDSPSLNHNQGVIKRFIVQNKQQKYHPLLFPTVNQENDINEESRLLDSTRHSYSLNESMC